MADLLDIAPSAAVEVVKIDGRLIKVRRVGVDTMASIAAQFPALKSIATGAPGDDFIQQLIAGCGAAVGPIIAAGCGHFGEEKYEQHAAALLPEQQIKFLRAIMRVTFPNGIGPFVEELTGLIGGASEGAKIIKLRSRKSPSPSQPSSGAASRPTMQ
jgi:hypothetical protein